MTATGSLRVKQRAFALAQPLSALLELTYHCNWRCVFCYNPRHSDIAALTVADWLRVLDDLRTLGALTVTLTGGEPLAHPEFLTIARAARERSFALRLFTNAALVDEAMATAIAGLYPQSVEVSVHGATAATHDRTTAQPGSFEALWRGVERLQAHGLRIFVKSPLTSINEHELEDMIALVSGKGFSFHVDPGLTARDDGDPAPLAYAPSKSAVARLMRQDGITHALTRVHREAGGVNCGLGRVTVAVDPEGNVYPCIQWRQRSLGNVRETPLAAMWGTSPARLEAAQVALDANTVMMAAGSPLSEFPFCPALAFRRGGDALAPDAVTLHQATLAAGLRRELER
jgi:MoaA/NifB/PqqE/SkfB family radical SAM enzyme